MSTAQAASLTIAFLFLALGVLAVGLCRAAARADRAHGHRVWDNAAGQWMQLPAGARPGPHQLTVGQVTAADPLELLYQAPTAEQTARLQHLRQAIRDEQQKEGQ